MQFNQINKFVILIICALLLSISAGIAQHDHSHHEDAPITVGTDALGKVNFPISGSEAAQQHFEKGLALLHHMMYVQAEKEFSALADMEPGCAMAYWGIAMTQFHPLWPGQPGEAELKQGWEAIQKAKSLNPPTEREQTYIAAVEAFYKDWQTIGHKERIAAWEAVQEKIYRQYPDDTDAAAFYALSHLATAPKADQEFIHQKEAGAILDKLFEKEPEHPGVLHYTIHAYDNPVLANRAVAAARAYDKIAPDVPHALHMPTHIFVRLGIWPDAISWNIRSAKAALKYPSHGSISHHYPHALDYLIYGYLQMAADKEAENVLKQILADDNYQKTFISAYALAAIPARYTLERQQWAAAAALEVRSPAAFPWEKFPGVETITHFARGLGAARSGNISAAQKSKERIDVLHQHIVEADQQYWAVLADAQRKTISAWIAFAEDKKDEALRIMREAADIEDSVDKHPVTPGAVLPARELLGEMLLLLNKPGEALAAYEASLKISSNRFNSLYGAAQAAERANNSEKAKSYYSQLMQNCDDATSDRPGVKQAKTFLASD